MTKDEALMLALDALEVATTPLAKDRQEVLRARAAIKEALAQPDVDRRSTESKETFDQQEPVVWMYQNKSTHEVRFQKHMRSFVDHGAWYEVPLYSEPLANQEKTSGSPKPAKTEALRLADAMEYDLDWCDEAAAELRRMHDLLGKANALCRIRAEEIERLKAQPEQEPIPSIKKMRIDVPNQVLYTAQPVPTSDTSEKRVDETAKQRHESEPVIDKSAAVRIATSLGWEPKRTWVGLSDEEIVSFTCECVDDGTFNIDCAHDFGKEIELALRQRNT